MQMVHGASDTSPSSRSFFDQPRSVWAVAFACVVAFMGIGLVDPILPTLAHDLNASPSAVSLLFTTYFAMTGLSMLVSGWVASRIGPRRTLLIGLTLVVAFSALAGAASSVSGIAGFRLGWGLGNALFIATALSVIVGAASGGLGGAIVLYEAALGLGIASGPLLGGLLGGVSWRGPFFGTATLMAIGFVLIAVLLPATAKPAKRLPLSAPLRALRDPGLATMAVVAVLYNFGFFTLLAYTPFPLGLGIHQLGFVFFGWGLLLALTSVFGAQRLERRFGLVPVLLGALVLVAVDLLLAGLLVSSQVALIVLVIGSGALLGIVNTVITEGVMSTAKVERPIASSAYSFVRFTGGAIAPFLAGKLAEHISPGAPLLFAAGMVALSVVVLAARRAVLAAPHAAEVESAVAAVAPVPAAPVVVAALRDASDAAVVVPAAARVAAARGAVVDLIHVRETRVAGEDAVDLEAVGPAGSLVADAASALRRRDVEVRGEALHVIGRHADAGEAIAEHARRSGAAAIIVGRPSAPRAASVALEVVADADCDVIVVAPTADRERAPAPVLAA